MKQQNHNNLYTLSYFRKRLKEADIPSIKLICDFAKDDSRYWAILAYPNDKNIIIICYKFNPTEFHFLFNISSNSHLIVKTKSMKIIIDELKMLKQGIEISNEQEK